MGRLVKGGAQPLRRYIQRGVKAGREILKGNERRHLGDGIFRKVALQRRSDGLIRPGRRGGHRLGVGQRRALLLREQGGCLPVANGLHLFQRTAALGQPQAVGINTESAVAELGHPRHEQRTKNGRQARATTLQKTDEQRDQPEQTRHAPPPARGIQHGAKMLFLHHGNGFKAGGKGFDRGNPGGSLFHLILLITGL